MTELEELAAAFDDSLADLLPMPELLDSARRDSELDANIREQIYGLGWPTVALNQEQGGLDLGAVGVCALAMVAGRRLLPASWRDEALLLIPCLAMSADAGDREAEGLLANTIQRGGTGGGVGLRAGQDLVLDSTTDSANASFPRLAFFVPSGGRLVTVVGHGRAVVVEIAGSGVTSESSRALDLGQGAVFLTAENTPLTDTRLLVGEEVELVGQIWRAALLAEAVGAAEQALALTVDHATTREQFGQTLASFQAVSHMLAEMKKRIELGRSAVSMMANALETRKTDGGLMAAYSYAIPQFCREVVESAIQVHGGIGFTWEYGLHLYYRRILQIQARLGGKNETLVEAGRKAVASMA
jgi:alkylation response protein AidB-like acyl-CoA dehydrogenase